MEASKRRLRVGTGLQESVKRESVSPVTFVQEPSGGDGGRCQPLLPDDHDTSDDRKAYELALQTFYYEEDEYSSLHSQFFPTNKKGRERMESQGEMTVT